MQRLEHVAGLSKLMFAMMEGDLFGEQTQTFIYNITSTMEEKAHRLSDEMTPLLIDDELALTAHADSMRSIAKFIEELPKDIERSKKNPEFMRIALERCCFLYAHFHAMEMRLR